MRGALGRALSAFSIEVRNTRHTKGQETREGLERKGGEGPQREAGLSRGDVPLSQELSSMRVHMGWTMFTAVLDANKQGQAQDAVNTKKLQRHVPSLYWLLLILYRGREG